MHHLIQSRLPPFALPERRRALALQSQVRRNSLTSCTWTRNTIGLDKIPLALFVCWTSLAKGSNHTKCLFFSDIRRSAYGSVYKAEAKDANMVLAIKMVLMGKDQVRDYTSNDSSFLQGEIRKEIDILKKCKHENVVRYFGSATKDNYLWVRPSPCRSSALIPCGRL